MFNVFQIRFHENAFYHDGKNRFEIVSMRMFITKENYIWYLVMSVRFNVLPQQICTLSLLANYCSSAAHIFCFLCIVMYVIFQVLLTRHKTLHSMYRWRLYHNPLRSDQPVVFQVGVEQDLIWVKYFRKAHGHDRFVQSDNQLIIEKKDMVNMREIAEPGCFWRGGAVITRKCAYGSVL